MSYSLNFSKGRQKGITIGVSKGSATSLDYSSYHLRPEQNARLPLNLEGTLCNMCHNHRLPEKTKDRKSGMQKGVIVSAETLL